MSQATDRRARKLSVSKAIIIGHVVVNGGVLLLIGITVYICYRLDLVNLCAAGIIGAAVAWPWWSVSVPRWRRWALGQGVDPEQLQKAGVRTGLVWPKGWIFEKTEIPPRKW